MFKNLFLGIAVAYGVYGVSAMDPELEKLKVWTPMFGGMPFPTMAIYETEEHPEPEELSKYHKTRKSLGYRCFMPKNQEEVDLLYNAYKAKVFVPDIDDPWAKEKGWREFLSGIEDEIVVRCKAGDMYHINAFLDHLEVFVKKMSDHEDRDFVGKQLFNSSGLEFTLSMAAPSFDSEKYRKLSRESIARILTRMDEIRLKIGAQPNLLKTALYLEGIFDTEEGKDILESFVDYFSKHGININI